MERSDRYFPSTRGNCELSMFDHKHYIPVLRWKRAEWKALGDLASGDRDRVTPLLELTPLSFRAKKNKPAPDPKDVLAKNAADMLKYLAPGPVFFGSVPSGSCAGFGKRPPRASIPS